ncbi:hypothetical protein Syun_022107 [Stephania yunnanensis]|uniref:Pentatricopeptide repeat-containing protein n=1 Tax=Stephania yunnanensis TaxID=152371 RepID=A0AAP0IHB5_9MAGN
MSLLSISRRKNRIPPNPSLLIIITRHSTISNSCQQEEQSTKNRAYWTKQIHNLCSKQGRVDEALRLLDRLCLEQAYIPNWLNLNSIIHALCDANCFAEAHRRLLLAISSNCAFDERSCNVLIARLLGAKDPSLTLRVLRGFLIANPEFVPTLMNYNRLIDQLCSSAGLPVEAYRLLIDMRRRRRCPDEVSYTSLMKGFCGIGDMGSAWKVFDEMRESGVAANSMTYSVLLRGVLRGRGGGEWRELMEKVWEAMIDRREAGVNNAAFANVVDSLCKEGYFHEVFRIAEEMPQGNGGVGVDEEFAYAQMMDSLCRAGRNHGASRIVYVMRKRGLVPSAVSYNAIIHGLSKEGGCMRAYQLYQQGTEWGHSLSESTYKVLVEGLCREFDIGKAKDVLQHMLSQEGMDKTRIYNIFLRALCFVENPSELLNVLLTMLQTQCQPDVVTLNTVITGFCKVGRVDEAWSVFTDMLNGNLSSPDAVTFTTIICGLLNSCKVDEALNLLRKKMPEKGIKPSVVTYNGVLRGLFKLQKVDDAMRIFDEMMLQGVVADSTTYTIVIEGLCGSNRIDEAKRFWDNVVWPSKVHDNFVYAAILKGLCGSGKSNEACDFLYELVDSGITPNIVNYNILIDHYCKLGLKKEAYQIVGEMKKNGLVPDAVTWRILDKLHATARKRLHNRDSKMRSQFLKEECSTQDGIPDVRTRSKTGFSALTRKHSFPR